MHSDDTLWNYLDGEMPANEAEALQAEAGADETLAARLAELRLMKEEVLAGAPTPPPGFPGRVAGAAATLQAQVFDLQEARRFLRRALVAATILAAVGLGLLGAKVLPGLLDPEPISASEPKPWEIDR